jgi:hypothetical protein
MTLLSGSSSLRPALYFAASAAILTLLLTGSRKGTLLIAAAVTLATFAVWPRRADQPIHAAVLTALLTNPIAAIVPTFLTKLDPRPDTPLVYLQIHANMTADVFLYGCSLLIVLFPIICHYWLTTPAPPPRL